MKRIILSALLCAAAACAFAQAPIGTDSVIVKKHNDTLRIGNILVIKKGGSVKHTKAMVDNSETKRSANSRISTNVGFIDLGFSNWNDQTAYGSAGNYLVQRPGTAALSKEDFKLRGGKSINVNIWLLMQRLSLNRNKTVNLKYGLGLELNNYRFRSAVSFKEDGILPYSGGMQTNQPFVFRDSISFSKNKLAADYATVPLMLNFSTRHRPGKSAFSLSVGASGGYLYSERNKQISHERGKEKNKGDYDLHRFKFSYVGDIGFGGLRLYGSYSPTSIFERGLDMRPFNIGIRISSW